MSIRKIHTEKAPAAVGPFSQGCIAGDYLYLSGQGGFRPEDGKVVTGGVKAEAEQLMQNIKAILEEAGADFTNVVKANCYLLDMADFGAFNEVYEKYFISRPARTCVAVKELPLGIQCEVEIVAYLK